MKVKLAALACGVAMSTAAAIGPPPAVAILSPPTVVKVEPPNWWTRHTWNPVRLLVRGSGLSGAHVETTTPGIQIGLTRVNARGTYLFVDLHVDPSATAGPVRLRIVAPTGDVEVPFALDAPLPREHRFRGFSEDDVIYLVMPDRFANGDPANDDPPESKGLLDRRRSRYYHGGDFRGLIDHLPYLQDLGVTALWLNPVYDNNDRLNTREQYDGAPITDYHGFGAVDFYGVEEHFGDLAAFRELVERAHALGIAIIQDQVANHVGPSHPWVSDSPTPTWFHGTEGRHTANTFQTHLLMDPGVPDSVKSPTLDGWFINILPDLNQDDEEMRTYLIQNSLWWIGATGLDGVRQDTLPYVPRWFWHDWTRALKREYPAIRVVGEVLDGQVGFTSFFQGGRPQFDGVDPGIDTVFDYPLFYPLRRTFAEGRSVRDVVDVLHQDRLYPNPRVLVTLLGSHDVQRFMNEPGATADGLRLAATFLLTTRGIPQWYYGDEIAMRGGNDPDNRRDFPGGWPDDPHNAFDPAVRSDEERQVFDHVRTLMRLRRETEALRRGRLVHLSIEEQTYVFARCGAQDTAIVAINNGSGPASLTVDVAPAGLDEGRHLVWRVGQGGPVTVTSGRIALSLGARSSAVLVNER